MIIAASKGGDLSEALVAHVLIRPELQPLQLFDHPCLLACRQDIRPIVEARRHGRLGRVSEHVRLEHSCHSASSPDAGFGEAFSRLDRVTPTRRMPRVGG